MFEVVVVSWCNRLQDHYKRNRRTRKPNIRIDAQPPAKTNELPTNAEKHPETWR
jgi:hypothetical protein